ncbi:MAG TPA: hypothetical protein VI298_07425 [Geobacteraceae bacterium]
MKFKAHYLIPTVADMLFLALFLSIAFSTGKDLLSDCDTGYHIRTGEFILNTHTIPRQDLFSFISPALPWTTHEWLSEVIMAAVYRASGLTGIVIFFALIISLIYYFFFKMLRAEKDNILLTLMIVLLATISSQLHWLARPHIFSLGLLIIWYHLLDEYHYRNKNLLFLLPPLMLLWANLHGGFITGFVLLGIYLLGNIIKYMTVPAAEKVIYLQKTRGLGVTIIFCLMTALINPFGYHILLFPFNLVSNQYIMDHIMEFISPNFHEPMPFKYFFFLMIAIFAVSKERLNFVEIALILFFTNMALYSVRYIPLFAIAAAPIMLRSAGRILDESHGWFFDFLKRKGNAIASIDGTAKGYALPAIGILAVVFCAADGRLEYKFDPKIKPVAAVEFLKREPIKGNMFDNDEFGDYIIYAASPQYKVFFDGRSDMYGSARLKEYNKVVGFDNGWEDVLNKYQMRWIIYNANSALSRFLLKDDGWRLIYADKVAHIFVRNIPEYQYLINKYRDVKPVPTTDKDNTNA